MIHPSELGTQRQSEPAPGKSRDPTDVDSLLPLAISQPGVALTTARRVVEIAPGPRERSIAHQAIAIVERNRGRLGVALSQARTSLRLAKRVDAEREADVLATLGVTLVYAGRTADGLTRLEQAIPLTPAGRRARVLYRRAHVLALLGRYPEAMKDLDLAVDGSRRVGDTLWEGRSLVNRSDVHLALGSCDQAEVDARRAETLLAEIGQHFEAVQALHNRALTAHQRGDLPKALTMMDAVSARYRDLGVLPPDLVIDYAHTLLTAGLAQEARAMIDDGLARQSMPPVKRAELLLASAQAALTDGDPSAARRGADRAHRLFARQGRPRWQQRAELLSLQAQMVARGIEWDAPRLAGDHRGLRARTWASRLAPPASALAASLTAARAPEAPVALLLAGRLGRAAGQGEVAEASLTAAARARHTGSPLGRAAGWLAAALLADHRGDRRTLLTACRRGLDAVDEHRALLGDLELRALATHHGLELAVLAVDSCLASGDTRGLLWWTERWRAVALVGASARQPADPALERDIAALRDVARRLGASADGEPGSVGLERERARREADVQRTYRHVKGTGAGWAGFDLAAVLALGDTVLISLINIRGVLYAVTAAGGRVRRRQVGSTDDALREAQFARFALRRAAHGRQSDLGPTAGRLQTALLGWPLSTTGPDRVVLVPPADLLTAPWGLLPAFADTVLTVSPSATLWLAARQSRASGGHVALVTGPGLSTGESEVTRLSPMYAAARSVGGADATVAGALSVLDGARLAHVAAHGTFRADAPLFSSLLMADGPLAVHDLDQLTRPPRAMVLSACDSGGAAPIGAHEALGLVSSLLAMGTSTVLASVVPVNDRATLTVMNHVHTVAGAGGSLAEGLLAARRAGRDDPLVAATAAAFTAWGA